MIDSHLRGASGELLARGLVQELLHTSEVSSQEVPDVGIDFYGRFPSGPDVMIGFQVKRYDTEGQRGIPLKQTTLQRWIARLDSTPVVILRVSLTNGRIAIWYCILYELLSREPHLARVWSRMRSSWWLPASAIKRVGWTPSGTQLFVERLRAEVDRVSRSHVIPYSPLTRVGVFRQLGQLGSMELPARVVREVDRRVLHSHEGNLLLASISTPLQLSASSDIQSYANTLAKLPMAKLITRESMLVRRFLGYLRTHDSALVPEYDSYSLRVWRAMINSHPDVIGLVCQHVLTQSPMKYKRLLTLMALLSYTATLDDRVFSGRATDALRRVARRIPATGMRSFQEYAIVRQLLMSGVEAGLPNALERYLRMFGEQRTSNFRWPRQVVQTYYGDAPWSSIWGWVDAMRENPTVRQERAIQIYDAYANEFHR